MLKCIAHLLQSVVTQSQRFLEQEEGYRPCDPAITIERIQQLEDAYGELVRLAIERRYELHTFSFLIISIIVD